MPAPQSTPHPQPNFDRVARLYRWAEYLSLGPLLQRTRTHFLSQLGDRRNAVLFGDGDGRFLVELLRNNQALQAVAVDTSKNMLRLLSSRCALAAPRLQLHQANALTHVCSPGTDLVITHFFLDCLTQPEVDALARQIAAQVAPGALWLLSDFRVPATGLLKPVAALYIRALYFAFRILTGLRVTHLPQPRTTLINAGFHRLAEDQRLGGILYTELWQLGTRRLEGGPRTPDDASPTRAHADSPTTKIESSPMSQPNPTLPAQNPDDAIPNPEPIAPSLPAPDPGVFHHEPTGDPAK